MGYIGEEAPLMEVLIGQPVPARASEPAMPHLDASPQPGPAGSSGRLEDEPVPGWPAAGLVDHPARGAPGLLVGEIRALRMFRLDSRGVLWPVIDGEAWTDGPYTAHCGFGQHAAAAPECSCGFRAHGSRGAASRHTLYPGAGRRVLAVVACWGRVIPGTLGLRAQHARIEAIWVSRARGASRLRRRYPSAVVYRSRRVLLREHPPTQLDCYSRARVTWYRARHFELPEFICWPIDFVRGQFDESLAQGLSALIVAVTIVYGVGVFIAALILRSLGYLH